MKLETVIIVLALMFGALIGLMFAAIGGDQWTVADFFLGSQRLQ